VSHLWLGAVHKIRPQSVGRGSIFRDFVRTSFMDNPLSNAVSLTEDDPGG